MFKTKGSAPSKARKLSPGMESLSLARVEEEMINQDESVYEVWATFCCKNPGIRNHACSRCVSATSIFKLFFFFQCASAGH